MKTLAQLRENIWNKISEVERLREDRDSIDMEAQDSKGFYINVDKYLEAEKNTNYAKGAVVRMIKKLIKKIYGDDCPFPINYDYYEAVREFKRFV